MCKPPAILVVPGGSARKKALALGREGRKKIREWVNGGGNYLGFCGGAGLALQQKNPDDGLGICAWERKAYPDRLYHLLSGSLLAQTASGVVPLPVWWPGRFEEGCGLDVLARYIAPGPDLWIADLPLMNVPDNIRQQWNMTKKLDSSLGFPCGQPLIVKGKFGQGTYVLSYAHLETPGYKAANLWLASFLRDLGNLQSVPTEIASWGRRVHPPVSEYAQEIIQAGRMVKELLELGQELGIFFQRAEWLIGWRTGAPGMACNHLAACVDFLTIFPETSAGRTYWQNARLGQKLEHFLKLAEEYLWQWRLYETLGKNPKLLDEDRNRIFGHPMLGGGLMEELLRSLEHLIWLQQLQH